MQIMDSRIEMIDSSIFTLSSEKKKGSLNSSGTIRNTVLLICCPFSSIFSDLPCISLPVDKPHIEAIALYSDTSQKKSTGDGFQTTLLSGFFSLTFFQPPIHCLSTCRSLIFYLPFLHGYRLLGQVRQRQRKQQHLPSFCPRQEASLILHVSLGTSPPYSVKNDFT